MTDWPDAAWRRADKERLYEFACACLHPKKSLWWKVHMVVERVRLWGGRDAV